MGSLRTRYARADPPLRCGAKGGQAVHRRVSSGVKQSHASAHVGSSPRPARRNPNSWSRGPTLRRTQSLQWATERTEHPQLVDLVARGGELEEEENDVGSGRGGRQGGRNAKRTAIYKDHLPNAELQKGMREGRLHQGTLVANRFRPGSASVTCDSVGQVSPRGETTTHANRALAAFRSMWCFPSMCAHHGPDVHGPAALCWAGQPILLQDHLDMNRSIDGDRVVVELLPEEQWSGGDASVLPDSGDTGDGDVGLAPAAAEEGRGVGVSSARRPTGRVVGIIKRNYHLYTCVPGCSWGAISAN
jgi:exoribonuclease R